MIASPGRPRSPLKTVRTPPAASVTLAAPRICPAGCQVADTPGATATGRPNCTGVNRARLRCASSREYNGSAGWCFE